MNESDIRIRILRSSPFSPGKGGAEPAYFIRSGHHLRNGRLTSVPFKNSRVGSNCPAQSMAGSRSTDLTI